MSKLKWKRTSRMDFFKAVNPFTNIAFQLLERRKKGQKKVRVFLKKSIFNIDTPPALISCKELILKEKLWVMILLKSDSEDGWETER